jgi:hypothetical protein
MPNIEQSVMVNGECVRRTEEEQSRIALRVEFYEQQYAIVANFARRFKIKLDNDDVGFAESCFVTDARLKMAGLKFCNIDEFSELFKQRFPLMVGTSVVDCK